MSSLSRFIAVVSFGLLVPILIITCSCSKTLRTNHSPQENNVFWEKLPIDVIVDSRQFTNNQQNEIFAATEEWENKVNFPLFHTLLGSKTLRRGVIYIHLADYSRTQEHQILGMAETFSSRNFWGSAEYITYCDIGLWRNMKPVYFLGTTIHEIGHCIGLHHSSNPADIMYPYLEESGQKILIEDIAFIGRFRNRLRETN